MEKRAQYQGSIRYTFLSLPKRHLPKYLKNVLFPEDICCVHMGRGNRQESIKECILLVYFFRHEIHKGGEITLDRFLTSKSQAKLQHNCNVKIFKCNSWIFIYFCHLCLLPSQHLIIAVSKSLLNLLALIAHGIIKLHFPHSVYTCHP